MCFNKINGLIFFFFTFKGERLLGGHISSVNANIRRKITKGKARIIAHPWHLQLDPWSK